jgi:hypothetical protein
MRHSTAIALIAAASILAAREVGAFGFSAGGGGGATKTYIDQQIAAVWAGMPQPANMAPPTDASAAAIGSTPTRYMLQDSVRPARYRSGSCQITGGGGQCTITWSTPFAVTPNPLGDPTVINGNFAAAQLTCNWIPPISATSGTVGCRSSVLGLVVLGNILTFLTNGTTVYGTAVQPL